MMTPHGRQPAAAANHRRLHRTVRWTARASGLLFAAAVGSAAAAPSARRASAALYAGFAAAHAAHFAAVSRFAVVTGGRHLFPGGRSLRDVGGWPTVLAIYAGFGVLVGASRAAIVRPPPSSPSRPSRGVAGRVAVGLIGAMFVGTYVGQLKRSRTFAVPAVMITASVTAHLARGALADMGGDRAVVLGAGMASSGPPLRSRSGSGGAEHLPSIQTAGSVPTGRVAASIYADRSMTTRLQARPRP